MKQFPIHVNNVDEFKKIFNDIDYILTDCDGVLYLHNNVIPNSNTFLNKARKLGKKVIYATNNSTKSRRMIIEKLNELNFQASVDEVMVTSYAAGLYLKKLNYDKKVYVFGSHGIKEEFDQLGIDHFGIGPDPHENGRQLVDFSQINLDPSVEAVVLGFDHDLSHAKLTRACSYAKMVSDKRPDLFIATNLDETYPTPNNQLVVPGTGSLIRCITTAINRSPISMGKPSIHFFECVKQVHSDIDPSKCLMIGDRLDTDIAFASNNKFKYSLFVESGSSTLDDIREAIKQGKDELVPTHYVNNLGELSKYLNDD